jgi:hypothetical protein
MRASRSRSAPSRSSASALPRSSCGTVWSRDLEQLARAARELDARALQLLAALAVVRAERADLLLALVELLAQARALLVALLERGRQLQDALVALGQRAARFGRAGQRFGLDHLRLRGTPTGLLGQRSAMPMRDASRSTAARASSSSRSAASRRSAWPSASARRAAISWSRSSKRWAKPCISTRLALSCLTAFSRSASASLSLRV